MPDPSHKMHHDPHTAAQHEPTHHNEPSGHHDQPSGGPEHGPVAEHDEEREAHLEKLRARLHKVFEGQDGQKGLPKKLDVRVVDVSAIVEQLAHRISEEKFREEMNKRGGLSFLKKGFMHMAEDGFRRKYFVEAVKSITENRNLMASIENKTFNGEGENPEVVGHERTLELLDEVLLSFDQELVYEEEKGDRFLADPEINGRASEMFVDYATGVIPDRAAFEAAVESYIIPLLKDKKFSKGEKNAASERENLMHTSTLFNWAEKYKDQLKVVVDDAKEKYGEQNAEAMKTYLKGTIALDISLGKKARDLVNRAPEGKLGFLEKWVSKVQGNFGDGKVSRVLGATLGNPVIHGFVGAMAGRGLMKMAIGGAAATALAGTFAIPAAGVIAGAITAGIYAKFRATKELKQDRALIQRDQTMGIETGGPRSERMKDFVQDLKSADTILAELRAIDPNVGSPEEQAAAKKVIAEVRARLEIERENMIDMIRVEQKEDRIGPQSRLVALNDIQLQFKRLGELATTNDPEMLRMIKEDRERLEEGIRITDKKFEEYKTRESNIRALKGMAIGAVSGTIMGVAKHIFHDPAAAVAHTVAGAKAHFAAYMFGGNNVPAPSVDATGIPLPAVRLHEIPLDNGATIKLPDDRIFVSDGKGNGMITTLFGQPVSQPFHINPDGSMTSADLLKWGPAITDSTTVIPGHEFSEHLAPHEFDSHAITQHFEVPDNFDMKQMPDGTFSLYDHAGKEIESGLQVGADGKLTASAFDMLKQHGWDVKEGITSSENALGKADLTKYLREHFGQSKATRLDWHGNGTPMHKVGEHWVATSKLTDLETDKPFVVDTTHKHEGAMFNDGMWNIKHVGGHWTGADGKELMLKLQGDADHRTLSLKDMIKTSMGGAHNPDGSVDDKFGDISDKVHGRAFAEAASKFRLRVFVGDNYQHSGESFELPVGPDGELHVDKSSELYGVLFDSEGKLKATVEAVVPSDDGAGYHTLATAVRHGDGAGVVKHVTSYFQLSHPNTDAVQHHYTFDDSSLRTPGPGPGPHPFPEPGPGPFPHPHMPPLPPEPPFVPDEDSLWDYTPFPIPLFPRDAMEMPKKKEKAKAQEHEPEPQPPQPGPIPEPDPQPDPGPWPVMPPLPPEPQPELENPMVRYEVKEGEPPILLPARIQTVRGIETKAFATDETARLMSAAGSKRIEPVVYTLEDAYVAKLMAKRSELVTNRDVSIYFEKNIKKIIAAVAAETGIEVPFTIVIGESKKNIDRGVARADKAGRELQEELTPEKEEPETEAEVGAGAAERVAREASKVESEFGIESSGAVTYEKRGKTPEQNEDQEMIDEKNQVFGIFDGMGGMGDGRLAAQLTKKYFEHAAVELRKAAQGGRTSVIDALNRVFKETHESVTRDITQEKPRSKGGTTAVLSVPFSENGKNYIAVASLADSRAYILAGDKFIPATADYVGNDIKNAAVAVRNITFADLDPAQTDYRLRHAQSAADLTEAEQELFAARNFVGSGIGPAISAYEDPRIQIIEIPEGDARLVLMSDGIGDNLTDPEIEEEMRRDVGAADTTKALADRALARSQEDHFRSKADDMTAVVIDLTTKK
ncbi:MAG: PP2C family protein-serine/threonine phosphatase [Candidatus Magasanikbacteria bacterium]|nr:PP2C family protein-serine/threonine phosphatase [Candidatus Magasanikbacteria bacterium]